MTAVVLSPEPERAWSTADRAPLLRWLIFTGATIFAAILLWPPPGSTAPRLERQGKNE